MSRVKVVHDVPTDHMSDTNPSWLLYTKEAMQTLPCPRAVP